MGKLDYNEHYFEMANPCIYDNNQLREPQIQGYYKVYEHFIVRNKKRTHAIVVLPNRSWKNGVDGITAVSYLRRKSIDYYTTVNY